MEYIPLRVVAAIIERDGCLLVAQRPLEKRHGGLWEFPGGKTEAEESDAEALARELDEEFGVSVLHVLPTVTELQDEGSDFKIAFVPVIIAGEPECREHIALKWAPLGELARMQLAPADRRFVDLQLSK